MKKDGNLYLGISQFLEAPKSPKIQMTLYQGKKR